MIFFWILVGFTFGFWINAFINKASDPRIKQEIDDFQKLQQKNKK
jgi:hypothetical protein